SKFLVWRVWQCWIVYALNCGMLLQEASHLQCIATMPFHAQCQRLQSPHNQVRLKRAEHRTQHRCVVAYRVLQGMLCANDNSGSAISMPTEIFCRAMHNHIETMFNGSNQVGCGESAIDNANCSHFLSSSTNSIQVDHLNQWIGECFHVDNVWLLFLNNFGNVGTA